MKWKKQWALLCLSGLLAFSGMTAFAENAAGETVAEESQGRNGITPGKRGAGSHAVSDLDTSLIDFMPGVLKDVTLSSQSEFVVLKNPETGELFPFGQIRVHEKKIDMRAFALSFACRLPEVDVNLSGVFAKDANGGVGEECIKALEVFNQKLAALPTLANMGILKAIDDLRQATGEDVPYSLASVDFRTVESLHLLRAPVRIATTGSRMYVYMDGWVFPVYVKVYVWQEENAYRFLVSLMEDNEKDALIKASDALAIATAGK